MDNDASALTMARIRQTDTNSLMRLADIASAILKNSRLQQERLRADRAIQRINKELLKRRPPTSNGK